MDTRTYLLDSAQKMGLNLSVQQIDLLLAYLALIQRWNKAYNLVGTSGSRELVQKHLLDSLALVAYINNSPVLDVGSGAGLPGIPLAISLPDISFTLLDSNGKKARFMRQVVMELKLTNVDIVQIRVENYQPEFAPNIVLSRAFAPLDKALEMLSAVCASQGQVQIMLGAQPDKVPVLDCVSKTSIQSIQIPELNSHRHLLIADRV